MRKIGKIARITIKPYPILRFDNEDHNHLLLDPPNNRNIHHNKSIIAKHAEILKASAAEANSVCLASNQIALESKLIAIQNSIQPVEGNSKQMSWISPLYNSSTQYQIY
jgi:peptide deformylase